MSYRSDASNDIERDVPPQSDQEDDLDESDGSQSDDQGGGLLDVEASETDGEESDEDGLSDGSAVSELYSFPQFMQLPLELRQLIWEFFDPFLRAPRRIFQLSYQHPYLDYGHVLEAQTRPARAMLATHSESRHIAVSFYPDILRLNPMGVQVRYSKSKDIIHLDTRLSRAHTWSGSWFMRLVPHLREVRYLAIEQHFQVDGPTAAHFSAFADLKIVYECVYADDIRASKDLGFVRNEEAKSFYVQTSPDRRGNGEWLEVMYSWADYNFSLPGEVPEVAEDELEPDVRRDYELSNYNKRHFPLITQVEEKQDEDGSSISTPKVYPMALFMSGDGIDRYDRLMDREFGDSDTELEDYSESDIGDYESDGIDDSPTNDEDEELSDEDDLHVYGLSDDEANEIDAASLGAGSIDYTNGSGPSAANFSSLEPESPEVVVLDGSDPENDQVPNQAAQPGKRPNRRVVDSHSEGESDEEEEVEEEEEEEAVVNPRRGANRRHVATSSNSENDDDDSDQEASGTTENGLSPSEDDDDDYEREGEPKPRKKPASLAERLGFFRRPNTIPDEDEDEDEDRESGEDASLEWRCSTDEEGSDNGVILDMAEEGYEDELEEDEEGDEEGLDEDEDGF